MIDKKKKEEEDKWAKENGFILKRDSCEACKKFREDKESGYIFCSPECAYEVHNLKKELIYRKKIDLILNVIDTKIMSLDDANRILDDANRILDDIENRYY